MLPQHRPYDYAIDLQEDIQPLFGPIYNLPQNKFAALRDYLDENLAKEFHLTFQISSRRTSLLC
jgi:hypothetical protein